MHLHAVCSSIAVDNVGCNYNSCSCNLVSYYAHSNETCSCSVFFIVVTKNTVAAQQ